MAPTRRQHSLFPGRRTGRRTRLVTSKTKRCPPHSLREQPLARDDVYTQMPTPVTAAEPNTRSRTLYVHGHGAPVPGGAGGGHEPQRGAGSSQRKQLRARSDLASWTAGDAKYVAHEDESRGISIMFMISIATYRIV